MISLESFFSRVKEENLTVNYLQVRKGGQIVTDYGRLDSKTRLNTWSVSKSFVSVGVGIAIDEGLLCLDDLVCEAFEDQVPPQAGENLRSLRVRDLLTMTTGLRDALFFADDAQRYVTEDWISYFFSADFAYKAGEKFLYSNFNTYMLSCMIERRAGTNLLEYLRHRLFEPLGIYSPDWTFCPLGHVHAANGLYVTIDELGNFGQMLLDQGVYQGRRIVSEAYLKQATKNQLSAQTLDQPEFGYGYQFWINPDRRSFRADGKFGQYVLVLPEKDCVIAVQSLESKDVFTPVWEEIALTI